MFITGQRWISEAEPELGLGTILNISEREVHIFFGATEVTRVYSPENAPLKRVEFKSGDKITDKENSNHVISEVKETGGLLTYICDKIEIPETDLSFNLSFSEPQTRLLKQHLDDTSIFDLRYESLKHRSRVKSSPVFGYAGARIDLIPHQLYVASQVTERKNPRVLLSDEVGLGKTVEAGLILHRKLLTGSVTRVLIVVPESLVHQWFVEIFRKFNIWLTIMDEERCKAVTEIDQEVNPFFEDQLIICSQELLLEKPQWGLRAVQGEWDLLIVDEAHHIKWSPDNITPEYDLASQLCEASKGVLLLTATPEQLGEESHFARLQLLDPERFFDLEKFLEEVKEQREIAELVNDLLENSSLTEDHQAMLKVLFKGRTDLSDWIKETPKYKNDILDALIDRHGPGRLIFRNTRKIMSNFPERKLITHPLEIPAELHKALKESKAETILDYKESVDEVSLKLGLDKDPRINWLVDILKKNSGDKFLFICSTREKAEAIEEAFRKHSGKKTVLFHEGMNLMQRDKNAVFFASPEGAEIMFCSEIGSEGRNFQFAHNLILWDLPVLPGLLEQRIGRLDRIGQTETIKVHVPYFKDSVQEVLLRYYHEGLDAFEHSLQGGNFLRDNLQGKLLKAMKEVEEIAKTREKTVETLIKETSALVADVRKQLDEGRDKLLEFNSFKKERAEALVEAVAESDTDHSLEGYLEDAFDYFGILHEEMSPSIWKIAPGPNMLTDALPALLPEGQQMTLRRQKALHDEQMMFLTWEHPLVSGMIDELLSTEKGNASFAILVDEKSRTLMLETVFVAECSAEASLQISRYLPATPVRLLVNHKLEDLGLDFTPEFLQENLEEGEPHKVLDVAQVVEGLIPSMLEHSKVLAEKKKDQLVEAALKKMMESETSIINRLTSLASVNPTVSQNEIKSLIDRRSKLDDVIRKTSVRLDSVRFIWKGSTSYFG